MSAVVMVPCVNCGKLLDYQHLSHLDTCPLCVAAWIAHRR